MRTLLARVAVFLLWPVAAVVVGLLATLWLLVLWPRVVTARVVREGNKVRILLNREDR